MKGRVVLVTGAAKRIGCAIVERLHAEGACIALHFRRSKQEADGLCSHLNQWRANSCVLFQADFDEAGACEALITDVLTAFGRLDGLVNNASSFFPSAVGSVDDAHWDQLMNSNARAPFFLTQAASEALKESQGSVVNLVDIHGEKPLKGYAVYSMAKAALVMMTAALARELAPQVRVNAVAPGGILTPEMAENVNAQNSAEQLAAKTALKRSGCPQDIAEAVLFLLARAPYITGQVITVDGGRTLSY